MKLVIFLKRFSTLVVGALLIACNPSGSDARRVVSLVGLLATPEQFIGEKVAVRGYLTRHGGLTLYLTSEHAAAYDVASSVIVLDPTQEATLSQSTCADSFVEIRGTFGIGFRMGTVIRDVESVFQIPGGYCWRSDRHGIAPTTVPVE